MGDEKSRQTGSRGTSPIITVQSQLLESMTAKTPNIMVKADHAKRDGLPLTRPKRIIASMPQELLKDIVHNGIAIDIFNAEEAYGIVDLIGTHANHINDASYGSLFGALQGFLNNSLILTVAKLYEKPKKNYVIRSIPSALEVLEREANNLEIPERPSLENWLSKNGRTKEELKSLTNSKLTLVFVEHFRTLIPKSIVGSAEELDRALHAVKSTRDKRISHNEQIATEAIPKPTYEQLLELIALAKEFTGAVGLPYFSMAYTDDSGDYLLSSDSCRSARCLTRVLRKLEVIA